MIALVIQQLALLFCAGLLIWAAVSDIRSYLIPNKIPLALLALYPAYVLAGFVGGTAVAWSGGLTSAAIVFAVGFVLFSRGLVGGGDVKLVSAVALYAGTQGLLPLIVVTALAGGMLSLGILAAKSVSLVRLPQDVRAAVLPSGVRFPVLRAALQTPAPYGAAIAFGGLFIIYQLVRA